jgi:uncharacterized protein (DUF1697 family)
MTIHIALLRGINVGGHRPVAMADLRQLLTKLGLLDVRSVLQSGNLVFESKGQRPARLEGLLEAETAKGLGLQAEFLVRTATEWRAVIAANPFREEAKRTPARLVVMFLKQPPAQGSVRELQQSMTGPETLRAAGRELYIVYPNGMGKSKLTGTLIEKRLGTSGSVRNWNTVERLDRLANP